MKCLEYRRFFGIYSKPGLAQEVWDKPHWYEYMDHYHDCWKCRDWASAQYIISRKRNPKSFPCVHIGEHVTRKCKEHKDPTNCSDILIVYLPKFDEYLITKLKSDVVIEFCPWCGIKLPDSKRRLWFKELEKLGFKDPSNQRIPKEFKDDSWFRKKK